ncbi:PilZ domain-containing protein [uncultured Sphingomonas sp.]|uniref:PilZ domain-containing protein n=1 Tax=uncultured Sphingomonas sp. TaxID=158754 RepID=UPI0035CC63E3
MASRASRYVSAEPASLEQRATPRMLVSITDATVRQHAAAPVTAVLSDLSAYGCRIASTGEHGTGEHGAGEHRAGDRVWVRLAGGLPIAATVVWSADGLTGCRFDEGLAREVLRALTLGAR